MGDSVREEVKQIFITAKKPGYLNETLITLIPKCKCPESLNNFRPISLCNSIYKAVIKVIVARIRPLLNEIISPFQFAFMPGRKGIDNAIIVQELIHSMARKRGILCVMAIKFDLEKAYDCLEWSFIRDTLALFKFPNHLISLIH